VADLPSRQDLTAIGVDFLVQNATKIDPNVVLTLGSDANLFVGSTSEVGYAIVLQLLFGLTRLLLDGATGDDLDRYALDRYGQQIPRKGAAPAVGPVNMYRLSNVAGAGTIPSGTVIVTPSGFQYITTGNASFTNSGAPTDLEVDNIPVRAVQAGTAFQATANQLNAFKQPGSNFDPTITVNNPVSTAGGADAEIDDVYRERIRSYWLTARRGILSAIELGAQSVPGVVSADADEVINGLGQPARLVNLYIADSSGVANAQLAALVLTALSDYRAAGIQVIISTSIPQIPQITLHLTFQAGVDTVTLSAQIQAAIVAYVNSLPVNGTLTLSGLGTVLQRFTQSGLIVTQGTILAPVGDIVPALGSTLRATLASVTLQ
jgi:uncharacterized phage protein gp47/JayE